MCFSLDQKASVIYRRSPRSVTMRCNACGLQWSMTFARIHEAAIKAGKGSDGLLRGILEVVALFSEDAAATAVTAGQASRERMTQMERRRVIRLGNGSA
jgi:hypothetical protein